MKDYIQWTKENLRVILPLAIAVLGGFALIVSSNLIYLADLGARDTHSQAKGQAGEYLNGSGQTLASLGKVNPSATGDVRVYVYSVDPRNSDYKGKLLHTEITERDKQLNFQAPEGIEPPYLLEFQPLTQEGFWKRASYIN